MSASVWQPDSTECEMSGLEPLGRSRARARAVNQGRSGSQSNHYSQSYSLTTQSHPIAQPVAADVSATILPSRSSAITQDAAARIHQTAATMPSIRTPSPNGSSPLARAWNQFTHGLARPKSILQTSPSIPTLLLPDAVSEAPMSIDIPALSSSGNPTTPHAQSTLVAARLRLVSHSESQSAFSNATIDDQERLTCPIVDQRLQLYKPPPGPPPPYPARYPPPSTPPPQILARLQMGHNFLDIISEISDSTPQSNQMVVDEQHQDFIRVDVVEKSTLIPFVPKSEKRPVGLKYPPPPGPPPGYVSNAISGLQETAAMEGVTWTPNLYDTALRHNEGKGPDIHRNTVTFPIGEGERESVASLRQYPPPAGPPPHLAMRLIKGPEPMSASGVLLEQSQGSIAANELQHSPPTNHNPVQSRSSLSSLSRNVLTSNDDRLDEMPELSSSLPNARTSFVFSRHRSETETQATIPSQTLHNRSISEEEPRKQVEHNDPADHLDSSVNDSKSRTANVLKAEKKSRDKLKLGFESLGPILAEVTKQLGTEMPPRASRADQLDVVLDSLRKYKEDYTKTLELENRVRELEQRLKTCVCSKSQSLNLHDDTETIAKDTDDT